MEALKGVTAAQAAKHPIPSAHSIWEIAHHIGTWNEVVRRRIVGEAVALTDDENFPSKVTPSPAAWKKTLEVLESRHKALVKVVSKMPDNMLDTRRKRGVPTYYTVIHGVIQHDLYHAGQISLLRKALRPGK